MGSVTITCRCPLCGKVSTVTCTENQWYAYEDGALAQEAFAELDLHTRETIISGMCLPCQESFFTEEEDDCEFDGDCEHCPYEECPC